MYLVDPKDHILKVSCHYLYFWLRYRGFWTMMMLLLMLRDRVLFGEWSSWRRGSVWSLWRGHPLEPHHHPPPLPCSKSGIWVEWLRDGLVGTSREISMAGRPFEEPPHQLFGLLVCLSSFCTELKYLKMPFFQFLAKTFITLEPFERFWKFKCLLIPFSKQYLLSSWFSWQQGVWMH